MSEQDVLSTWLTTSEACARLGISERTLDRKVAAHQIERRNRPAEGRRPIPVHNPEDIERLMTREPAVEIMRAIAPSVGGEINVAANLTARLAPAVDQIVPLVVELLESIPRPPRPWMTIGEASAYSGLPKAGLRRLVRTGALPSVRGQSTLVRKVDVDELTARDFDRTMTAEN